MAGLALSAAARLGRAGIISTNSAVRCAGILAADLGDESATFVGEVWLDDQGRHARLACDLRYEQYRLLFLTSRSLLEDRLALMLIAMRARCADAVFDVGSNAGIFAYAAAAAGAQRVFAFEPIPRLATLLRENAARNTWGATVRVHQEIVGGEDGTTQFFVLWPDTESTMMRQRAADRELLEELSVPIVRLDSFCQREGVDARRAVFKIDVNGTEMAALAGLGGLLDLPEAPDLVIDLLAQSLEQGAIEQLCARGYQIYYLSPGGPVRVHTGAGWLPHQDLLHWDFFLTKREFPF
jgi:FkbM family methyltransferase